MMLDSVLKSAPPGLFCKWVYYWLLKASLKNDNAMLGPGGANFQ